MVSNLIEEFDPTNNNDQSNEGNVQKEPSRTSSVKGKGFVFEPTGTIDSTSGKKKLLMF